MTNEEMRQLYYMIENSGWRSYYQSSPPAIDVDYEVVKETTTEGGIEKLSLLQASEKDD